MNPTEGHLDTKHGRQVTVVSSVSGNIVLTSKSAQMLNQYKVKFYEWTEENKKMVAFSFLFKGRCYIPTVNNSKLEVVSKDVNPEDKTSCFTWANEDKGYWYRLESLAEPGMMLVIKKGNLYLQDRKTHSKTENVDNYLFRKS